MIWNEVDVEAFHITEQRFCQFSARDDSVILTREPVSETACPFRCSLVSSVLWDLRLLMSYPFISFALESVCTREPWATFNLNPLMNFILKILFVFVF